MTRREKQVARLALKRQQEADKAYAKLKRCVVISEMLSCCADCEYNNIIQSDLAYSADDESRWHCSAKSRKDIFVKTDFVSGEVIDAHCFGNRVSVDVKSSCDFLGILLIEQ